MSAFGPTNFGAGHELDGAAVFYDVQMLGQSLATGDWVAAGMFGAATALDGVATAIDPLGSLFAAGAGWLIEHLEPLKGWLDDLAGDPGAILGQAAEMDGVAAGVAAIGTDLRRRARRDVGGMDGEMVDSYLAFNETLASGLESLAESVRGGARAIETASSIVEMVRGVVRDAVAQVVGMALSCLTQAIVTAGLATPWLIAQVSARVSALSARCAATLLYMTRSFDELGELLMDGMVALRKISTRLQGYQPRHRAAPTAPDFPRLGDELRNIDMKTILGSNAASTGGNATNDNSDAQNEWIDERRASSG